jgi:FAD-linked sulfhydryl oxidase
VAAYYPAAPAPADERAARGLLEAVARLYPCTHCRAAFAADLAARPPRLGSRDEFAVWLCEAHNGVNEALGRTRFECDARALDVRWRSGASGCWPPSSGGGGGARGGGAAGAGAGGGGGSETAEESLGQALGGGADNGD